MALILGLFTSALMAQEVVAAQTLTLGGGAVMKLSLPNGWKSVTANDVATLLSPSGAPHVQLWMVADAGSVADAEGRIAALVASQVKDFVPASTVALTVAGGAAKQLIGTGTEADDGDASQAEVTVFSVGGKVFILCAHGEGDGTAKSHQELVATLASIAAP